MEQIKKHPKIFMIMLMVILLVFGFFIAINLGSIKVSMVQLFKGLFVEYDVDVASVYNIRFPRIIIAMLVGWSFGFIRFIISSCFKKSFS